MEHPLPFYFIQLESKSCVARAKHTSILRHDIKVKKKPWRRRRRSKHTSSYSLGFNFLTALIISKKLSILKWLPQFIWDIHITEGYWMIHISEFLSIPSFLFLFQRESLGSGLLNIRGATSGPKLRNYPQWQRWRLKTRSCWYASSLCCM